MNTAMNSNIFTKQHYINQMATMLQHYLLNMEYPVKEIIVDNFAGGGGASTGIELATGRSVDIAINHDPEAIKMHKVNHPSTKHYCESVWDVNPLEACKGRPVGLAWFSPDCKHFSKAKGSKPKNKTIRGLAWVALRWAAMVRPRVIILENVEEFKTWGPLNRNHRPIKAKQGQTFMKFVCQLKDLGYDVEYRELLACDYGAPTKRKRFFLIARCDGRPIVWPEPTHGDRNSRDVKEKRLLPYVPAADIIDWSIPCKSIFGRKKPLADNTLNRIARGLKKFVIDAPDPFIIQVNHTGSSFRGQEIDEPLPTITSKHGFAVVTPYISQIGQTGFSSDRSKSIKDPITTVVSKAEHCLISPYMIQYHSETAKNSVRGQELKEPIMTLDSSPRYALVASFLSKFYKSGTGQDLRDPIHTITTSAGHFAEIRAFLIKYYGQGTGQAVNEPLDTIVSKDRFGLVTILGQEYQIVDIGLRMLEPHELYAGNGFPDDYIIDHDLDGNTISKVEQVYRCGNAVPPPFAKVLVSSNAPELCVGSRIPNMRIDFSKEQLKFA